ncbi:hypothetical protein HDU81_010272 [Chytriomyces hyalinus]|nr:hypothetical protein HDU81_010272 [Chytriomyces hyalinus]
MDAIVTQLTQVNEEIDALKKKVDRREEALEKAIEADKPAGVMASLQSLFEGATAELKGLREKEVELMRQKDRLTAVIEAKQGSRNSSDSSLSIKEPHAARRRRWEELNRILSSNKKKLKTTDSVGYSYVTWSQVKDIFNTKAYKQTVKEIPEDTANLLFNYLSVITKCFGPITTGKESQRLHFIAPIIIYVSTLFKGDVTILVEEDLDGIELKALCHFEFVLRRGNKRVCIVEAKKDDIEQGLAQDLLGCEVAAELDNLDKVMGIVTNYVQWNFLRSLDESIEMDECSMEVNDGYPNRSSLLNIAGKIYSMLSD